MITNLDEVATQTGFASLIGVSQQAISKRVDAGTLTMGQTYRVWLQALFEKLSTEAAGRSGEDQASLTRARTDEATASAELKRLMVAEKSGQLVPVAEIEPQIAAMVIAARTELLAMADKLYADIKALYNIEIDPALINEKIYAALEHLSAHPGDDAADDARHTPVVGAAAATLDD